MDERERIEAAAAQIAERFLWVGDATRLDVGDEVPVGTDSDGSPLMGTVTGWDGSNLSIAVRMPFDTAVEIGAVVPGRDQ